MSVGIDGVVDVGGSGGGSVVVMVGRMEGFVAMRVGVTVTGSVAMSGGVVVFVVRVPLPPSYRDMFVYERPVEMGERGDAVVDTFEYGAAGSTARMKAMWSGSLILTNGPKARTHSSVDHEAPRHVVLRSSHLAMQ